MNSRPRIPSSRAPLFRRIVAGTTLAAFLATPPYAAAAVTDISNAPLASAASAQIPPNVMFILDNSGSMDWTYMPDSAQNYDGDVGGKSNLCNQMYYNPATTYLTPKKANGDDFLDSNFTSASPDGFLGGTAVNLSTSFRPNGSSSSEPAYYYRWKAGDAAALAEWNALTASQKNSECDDNDSSSFPHTTGNWTKVQISTAAEQQNFANWYTYYRTRMAMMKSAAGRAFVGLNDSFRVGFITICPTTNTSACDADTGTPTVQSAFYLKIDNFTPSHKQAWFDKFYSIGGNSRTPLRTALSRVGRHYAGKTDGINSGMSDDPIQESCQQNFAILTTDGYWNRGYGRKLDGTTMDHQDGNLGLTPRPMYDGGPVNTVRTEYYFNDAGALCTGGRIYDRQERKVTTNQNGSVSTSSWSRVANNVCTPTATYTGCTSSSSPCVAGTETQFAGGVGNTLADVAEYYYRTDLRPTGAKNAAGVDVSKDNVPQAGTGVEDDKAQHQHMTTFTLGLGLEGQLDFQPNYKTGAGDFAAIRSGTKGWPNPNPSNSDTSNSNDQLARIDDLWHAAVNGRGQSFSATDPTTLAVSLQTALSAIQVRLSSAAAAATSSLEPTLTDRLVFTPTYTTGDWSGDVQAHEIDITTGAVSSATVWSAQANLDTRVKAACDDRKILLHRPGSGGTNLVDFTWSTSACDGSGNPTTPAADGLDDTEKKFFSATEVATFTQWGLMTDGTNATVDQRTAAEGANLVNFVRGQRGKEDFVPDDANRLYRARKHVLGDVVNSQPVYVRQPFFDYLETTDPGYDAFKSTWASRAPMVYVAANDGMLHAFYAGTITPTPNDGHEAWAFIPRAVLPRLHRLADSNYSKLHEYTVDATPTVGDVYDKTNTAWKTIAVAGLNKGGRAYYAVDITDPSAPKGLWEFAVSDTCFGPTNKFSDCDLGYSYGNPVISKLEDGRWVVFVTSGYNNVSPGDGKGYLYVLDALTGEILYKIGTGAGDTSTPSGLSKIRNWVSGNAAQNNTTARVYGVDLLGNIWRFDVNDSVDGASNPIMPPAGREATLLATVMDPDGVTPQPLTVRPELAEVGSPPVPFVYVATGRYLGTTDVTTSNVQSIYAIRDTLGTTPVGDLRSTLTKRTMTTVGTERFTCTGAQSTAGDPTCDPNAPKGWYVDLPDTGERVNVDMKLQLGTLVVASNVPGATACDPGGYSYKNYFDYSTGLSPAGATQPVGSKLSNALAVGINVIRLPDGRIVVIGMDSSGTPQTFDAPIASGAPSGKRITWREITQ
jgi:type IV pilus assembly protein PilY1